MFYIGRYKRGILYLLFCWTYIPILLGWIDMFSVNKWFNRVFKDISNVKTHIDKMGNPNESKIEIKSKVRDKSSASANTFYSADNIILDKYKHLVTPRHILESLQSLSSRRIEKRGGITIEIYTNQTEFAKDSVKYASIRGEKTSFKPLHAYWTTFKDLDKEQRKWYFYWRERALNGEYLDTDLSYIILFSYELINYTFNNNAAFNVSMMERLYENYKDREDKIKNYLPTWIGDFLIELGEKELAEFWARDNGFRDDILYEKIITNEENLDKISITVWKQYLNSYRETEFYRGNKNKIYDTFKQAIIVLNEFYKSKNSSIAKRWFMEEERVQDRYMFASAIVGRSVKKINNRYIIHNPNRIMYNEINALFRLSENVARFLTGEKREIKVQSEFLPENFREILTERVSLQKPGKKAKDRFKLVKEAQEKQGFVDIPAPPQEKQEKSISFDMSKIEELNRQSEKLQSTFREKGYEDDEIEQDLLEETAVENIEVSSKEYKSNKNISDFLSPSASEEEDEFINSLTDVEYKYIATFNELKKSVKESNVYFKSNGVMGGTFISSINEKANEYLDDNIITMNGDNYEIYEEYEDIIIRIKKGETHEN
jgi:hypothetical protein